MVPASRELPVLLNREGLGETAEWFLLHLCRPQRFSILEYIMLGRLPPSQIDGDIEVRQASPEELKNLRRSNQLVTLSPSAGSVNKDHVRRAPLEK